MSVDWCDINGDNAFSWLRLVALKTDWFAEERDHYIKKKQKAEDTATVFSLVIAVSVGKPGKDTSMVLAVGLHPMERLKEPGFVKCLLFDTASLPPLCNLLCHIEG